MKKILVVCLALLLGIVMVGCAKVQEINEIPGVAFDAPEKWSEYASSDSTPGYDMWKYEYNFGEKELIEIMAAGGVSDEETAMDLFYTNNLMTKMEINDQQQITIGDKSGWRMSGTTDVEDVSYQNDMIVIQKGDYIYAFTYRWAVDQKPQYAKEYDKLVNSIKFVAVDEKFLDAIANAKDSEETGDLSGFTDSAVQVPVDEEVIKNNIKADSSVAVDGDLVTIFTNENDMLIPILNVQVIFYDEGKNMIGTDEKTFPAVAPGATVAADFECMDSDYNPVKFAEYEMTMKVDMNNSTDMVSYVDQVGVEHNNADGKAIAKLTNHAPEKLNSMEAITVFYSGENIVGTSYTAGEYDVAPGSSVTVEMEAPYGEDYEPLAYDKYTIFINYAFHEG